MSPHSCLVRESSAPFRQDLDKYLEYRATFLNRNQHLERSRTPLSRSNLLTRSQYIKPRATIMSGYYGQGGPLGYTDDEAQRLLSPSQSGYSGNSRHAGTSSGYPSSQQSPYSSSPYTATSSHSTQAPGQTFTGPCQYVSWPTSSYPQVQPMDYTQTSYPTSVTSLPSSSPYSSDPWSNAPWPALHPDDLAGPSDASRPPSPLPSDPGNYGILLPDGRSWRCKYPGCNSEARFTRGCDLRKHYKRHTKSLFCRYDSCEHQGGFSSNKDRVSNSTPHVP